MTVVKAGESNGDLLQVTSETGLETDQPMIEVAWSSGRINSDLTVGVDVTKTAEMLANRGLAHDGVKLHGKGFVLSPSVAAKLGLGSLTGIETYIRPYRSGRDFTAKPRTRFVADLFGLSDQDVRNSFPDLYQHLLSAVKFDYDANGVPRTDKKGRKTGREWNSRTAYKKNWWVFGEPRPELRPALAQVTRFIFTVDTAKHRVFQFAPTDYVLDDKLVIVALEDAFHLAVLSSRAHVIYTLRAGGRLGEGNDPVYTKTRTFDPFPFPDPNETTRSRLRDLGEELDATRKAVQVEHSDLTLTGLYNVLEKLRAGTPLSDKEQVVKDRGRVLILKDLHEQIDRATADAYDWPYDLSDEAILERLVSLNAERAAEEAAAHVRWLRPDYQIPRFARGAATRKSGELDLQDTVVALDRSLPAFPKDKGEQVMAIRAVLQASGATMDAAHVSRAFKAGGRRIEPRVAQALATLLRYGEATALPGGNFAARRAA